MPVEFSVVAGVIFIGLFMIWGSSNLLNFALKSVFLFMAMWALVINWADIVNKAT